VGSRGVSLGNIPLRRRCALRLHQHLLGRPACKLGLAHGHPCQKPQHCPSLTGAHQEPTTTTSTTVRSTAVTCKLCTVCLRCCSLSHNTRRAKRPVSLISSYSCSLIGLLCHEVFASQSRFRKRRLRRGYLRASAPSVRRRHSLLRGSCVVALWELAMLVFSQARL
jgi:hypothetical protein